MWKLLNVKILVCSHNKLFLYTIQETLKIQLELIVLKVTVKNIGRSCVYFFPEPRSVAPKIFSHLTNK